MLHVYRMNMCKILLSIFVNSRSWVGWGGDKKKCFVLTRISGKQWFECYLKQLH